MQLNTKRHTKKPKLLAITAVIVVVCIGAGLYWYVQNKNPADSANDTATTTSKQESAQNDFTGAGKKDEYVVTPVDEGVVTDSSGVIGTVPAASQWSQSSSGDIIVYSPTKNGVLTSGSSLMGEAKSNQVSFRLIDNVRGVIAQGKISVINGKYSGLFDFTTTATEGRVDVFTATADGIEQNIVEIPVRFQ